VEKTPRKRRNGEPASSGTGTPESPPAIPSPETSLPSRSDVAPQNGGQSSQTPLKVLTYQVGHDTYLQASIWERKCQRKDGTPFVTYDVSLRKRYQTESGEWKSSYAFLATELFAAVHALQAAAYTICELRIANVPF
jgi:hypothetical protein